MVRDLFKEELDFYKALLTTKIGIFRLLIGNLISGFIIVRYTDNIYKYIFNLIPLSGFLQEYLAYLFFGLVLIPLWIGLTFGLTRIYYLIFKSNGRVI